MISLSFPASPDERARTRVGPAKPPRRQPRCSSGAWSPAGPLARMAPISPTAWSSTLVSTHRPKPPNARFSFAATRIYLSLLFLQTIAGYQRVADGRSRLTRLILVQVPAHSYSRVQLNSPPHSLVFVAVLDLIDTRGLLSIGATPRRRRRAAVALAVEGGGGEQVRRAVRGRRTAGYCVGGIR